MTDSFVHSSAEVEEGAVIGEGTKIWNFSHIRSSARIGKRCNIGQNVFIDNAVIGNGVKIQNNVSVYTGVHVEDDCFLGPSVVFTNVSTPRAFIDRRPEIKNTYIRKGATLGANATIVCGVTVGRYSFVGAGAVVTKDVPDHALVFGNPALLKGWVCECGIKLNIQDNAARCDRCGQSYEERGGALASLV